MTIKNKIKKLKEYIKSCDWVEYSCGRSTDYMDEFSDEWSADKIIKKIDEIFKDEK